MQWWCLIQSRCSDVMEVKACASLRCVRMHIVLTSTCISSSHICIVSLHIVGMHMVRQITAQRFPKVCIAFHSGASSSSTIWAQLILICLASSCTSHCLWYNPISWIRKASHCIEAVEPENNETCSLLVQCDNCTAMSRIYTGCKTRAGPIVAAQQQDDGYSYSSSGLIFMSSHTNSHIHHISSKPDNWWTKIPVS